MSNECRTDPSDGWARYQSVTVKRQPKCEHTYDLLVHVTRRELMQDLTQIGRVSAGRIEFYLIEI